MISKQIRQAWKRKPRDQTWKQIDKARIPLSTGRIWLADKDGNVRRAIAWTWPILNRREPHKYRWWMNRIDRARAHIGGPCGLNGIETGWRRIVPFSSIRRRNSAALAALCSASAAGRGDRRFSDRR